MGLLVKTLNSGMLVNASEPNDDAESPPVTTIYPAGAGGAAAMLTTMRFMNTTTDPVTMKLYVQKNGDEAETARLASPNGVVIPGKGQYVDPFELTLNAGDKLHGFDDAGSSIEYVLSGVEQETDT